MQLAACGVGYFDFFLMHAQDAESFKHFKACRAYEAAFALKAEGKVRHVGMTFYDRAEVLNQILNDLHGGSAASYAIRFVAGFPGIMMVLSGMSNLSQMQDNLGYMKDFKLLDEREMNAVKRVQEIFKSMNLISCTACRYCTAGCPKHISVPDLAAAMNARQTHHDWNADYYYDIRTCDGRRASDCIKRGKREKGCPQHLHIRDLLQDVAKEFEKA